MIFTTPGPVSPLPSRRAAMAVLLAGLCGASVLAQTPTPGTVVASPGSTVVVQPPPAPAKDDKAGTATSTTTTPGLIVAAPGSTVVVANPPAAPAAKKDPTPPNTFAAADKLNIIQDLLHTAKNRKVPALARAGAIDALGSIGGNSDVAYHIASGLSEVLDVEFSGTTFEKPEGKFICYYTVKALGQLGWGGKTALSKMQLLRGQDVILDAAIDHAVYAIRTGPVPAKPKPPDAAGGGN